MGKARPSGDLNPDDRGRLDCRIPALAQSDLGYHPIDPTEAGKTITLTGHDMTIDEVIEVARGGAKVQLSAEAKQREADNYGLLLEAPAEGVSVYWFTRGAGAGREVKQLRAIPCRPKMRTCSKRKCWRRSGGAPPTRWRARRSTTKRWFAP